MTVVTRTIRSSHPEALLPLRVLAHAAGLGGDPSLIFDGDPIVPGGSGDGGGAGGGGGDVVVEMVTASHNPFNSHSFRTASRGYGGVARSLCRTVPEAGLWGEACPGPGLGSCVGGGGGGGEERAAAVSGWIEHASSEVGGAAYGAGDGRAKDPHHRSAVQTLASSIESHLFSTSSTFLVGDVATAADVIVAVLLSASAGRAGVEKVPQQTARWCETVLRNDVVRVAMDTAGVSLGVPGCGAESPSEKPPAAKPAAEPTNAVKPAAAAAAAAAASESEGPAAAAAAAVERGSAAAAAAAAAEEDKGPPPTAAAAESSKPRSDDDADLSAANPIVRKLDSLSLPHRTYAHPPCVSAEELVSNVPVPPGETHAKNLFLRDKRHGLFLVTVRPDAEVNTKALGGALGLEGKVNLRLAAEDALMGSLGCRKGCVGPLAIMNDAEREVTLVMDEGLLDAKRIHSHPMTNDASTVLEPDDLKRFLDAVGVEPTYLPFHLKGEGWGEGGEDKEKWAGKAPSSRPPEAHKKPAEGKKAKQEKGTQQKAAREKSKDKKTSKKGETLLALRWKKSENFAMWYSDVIVLSEMISYYDISGCYILRPWSYKIWELIQEWFNDKIRELDVENAYFPLFVSKDRLEKEKDHVEGFAPEVAWVTKSGDGTLAKPIAVRPTSETIMYPSYSDWIKSHRDLPLKLNQWSNVVRWEFKDPTPFLRSREFLWQEGHTAHSNHGDAEVMVRDALELYRGVYEDLLAVPVIPGYKTEKEKFAGGYRTTTVEAYVPMSGRAIQGATSHDLGQNFGRMFDITFQDEGGKSQIAWQTSWGLTTRTIGVMVMVHGDDSGLVLPPRVAPLQAVIVPIISKKFPYETADPYCRRILSDLQSMGVRSKYDDRDLYNPGWKYNHWEQKGVPLRVEVGPRDVEGGRARVVTRYSGEKEDVPVDGLAAAVKAKLGDIQRAMFEKARAIRDGHVVRVTEWKDFVPNLELSNLVLTPWCGGEHRDWEDWVKEKSREESLAARGEEGEDARAATSVAAKTLCVPFDQPELAEGARCFASGLPATCWVLWGRSY